MISYFKKWLINLIVLGVIFIYNANVLFAQIYNPGETLDPTCLPTDVDCTVRTPAISGINTDITRLTSLENKYQEISSTGVIIPMYIYPADIYSNETFNNLINLKKQYHNVNTYVILNPNSGPGSVEDGNYTVAIKRLHGADIKVLGYVATNYLNSYTVDQVKEDVDTWKTLYPEIDGIFFDDMSSDIANINNYSEISRYTHNKGYSYTICNPGADVYGEVYNAKPCDYLIIHENSLFPSEASLKGDWADGKASFNYKTRGAIIHSRSSLDIENIDLLKKYLGLIYVTNDGLDGNAYDSVSTYLPNLFDEISSTFENIRIKNNLQIGDLAFSLPLDLSTENITGILPVNKGGTGLESLPTNQILFGNGTNPISSDSNLYWDNVNKRLGIGTTNPSRLLHIDAGANNEIYNAVISGTGPEIGISLDNNGVGGRQYSIFSSGASSIGSGKFGIYDNEALSTRFIINSEGDIGMGTENPLSTIWENFLEISSSTYPGLQFTSTAVGGRTFSIGEDIVNGNGTLLFHDNTSSATKMAIGNSGIGIGTNAPGHLLNLKGDSAEFMIESNDYDIAYMGRRGSSDPEWDKGYLALKSRGLDTVVLDTNGISYFNGGNVGVGTINPYYPLQISKSNDSTIQLEDASGILGLVNTSTVDNNWMNIVFSDVANGPAHASIGVKQTDHTNNYGEIHFVTKGSTGVSTRMKINEDGIISALGIYNNSIGITNRAVYVDDSGKIGYLSSSLKYKHDIVDMEDTSWIYNLRPVNFVYNNDPTNTKKYGLIAEEVEKVNPSFVYYNNNEVEGVDYQSLITPVVKELQNKNNIINELSGRINNLEIGSSGGIVYKDSKEIIIIDKSTDLTKDTEVVLCKNLEEISIALPDAIEMKGKEITIKLLENKITLNAVNFQKIDDREFMIFENKFESIRLISDGENWFKL